MKKHCLLGMAFLFMAIFSTFAQKIPREKVVQCYFDEIMAQQIKKNPQIQNKLDSMNLAIERHIGSKTKGSGAVPKSLNNKTLIPVVVNVVHQNGPENISDQQVISQIDALNTYYEDYGIAFCLATKKGSTNLTSLSTPSGITSSTPGIFHYYSPSLTNHNVAQQSTLMASLNALPSESYLRIWIVKSITSSTLPPGSIIQGYSSLPQSTASYLDGIVMDYRAFGDVASCGCTTLNSYSELGRISVHEVGHYLGLQHTFNGGCPNANSASCSFQGDFVCDTPPVAVPGNTGCPALGWNTCNETPDLPDDIHNYMDYVDETCMTGFTNGQHARMEASIEIYRGRLVSSENLVYTGINCNNQLMAHFAANTYTACTGTTITFTANAVAGATYSWNFGDGTTGTGQVASHTYTSAYSPATVVLTVSNGSAQVSNTENLFITSCSPIANTQSTWMFGNEAGLNFSSGIPVYDNSADVHNTMQGNIENVVSQCDAAGNLLFYSNGNFLWDKNHSMVSTSIGGDNSSATGAMAIPNPGVPNQYFLFNTSVNGGLIYSVLNTTSTTTNVVSNGNAVPVPPGYETINGTLWSGEAVTAIKGCNFYWLIVHGKKSEYQQFLMVYKVSASGVTFHSEHPLNTMYGHFFTMEASPDGTKILVAEFTSSKMHLCDFNPLTGTVNGITQINRERVYGTSFSSDSKLFYAISELTGEIFQYEVAAPNVGLSEIKIGQVMGTYSVQRLGMQMGPDNKIYMSRNTTQMGVIHEPNIRSTVSQPNLCFFDNNGPFLDVLNAGSGVPNMIDAQFADVFAGDSTFATQLRCDTYTFGSNICASSYSWNFGDPASGTANTSSDMTPTHIFSGPGTYTVSVTANGVNLTYTVFIPRGCEPCSCDLDASFAFTEGEEPCSIKFAPNATPVSCLQNVTYNWDFGDGNTATGTHPEHVYAGQGTYDVCLTITANNGTVICSKKFCQKVETKCSKPCECKLRPSFDYSFNEENCLYIFQGIHGGPDCLEFVEYHWDFGDGTTATGQTAGHIFSTTGSHNVCLTVIVRNDKGDKICSEKFCKKVEVRCTGNCECALDPKFEYTVNEETCLYNFSGFSGGPACLQYMYNVEYQWDFGDGSVAIGQNPAHVYANPGNYYVCLHVIVKNANGEKICDQQYCRDIDVKCKSNCECKLKPEFSYSLNEENCKYTFQGIHGGPDCLQFVEYTWDFGDGTTGSGQNPTHVFASPGTYKVCMYVVVKDANGNKICDDKYCLEIEVNCQTDCECKLKPEFSYTLDDKTCVYTFNGVHGGPDCLQFVEYYWNFGDGTTAMGQNQTHIFANPGTYTVCMHVVVKDANGNKICDKKYCNTIEVNCQTDCECKLKPEFSYTLDDKTCVYTFNGVHGGPDCLQFLEYTWDFGDGTTGAGQNPTHVFANPGTYKVCMYVVVKDANGNKICDDKYCLEIDVNCQIDCECKLRPVFGYSLNEENCVYTFQGTHGGPDCLQFVEYHWDFGDGTTATGPNPTHVFPNPGGYNVCMHVIVKDANGNKICEEKFCMGVDVTCQSDCECKLKPEFSYTLDDKTCVYSFAGVHGGPDCLQFVEYTWDFGDGTTGAGQNPTHVFANPGTYKVCMYVVVKDANGNKICDDKYCLEIDVNCQTDCECKLKPEFNYWLNRENCEYKFQGIHGGPDCLQFVEYTWDFGDGTTGAGQNPTHVFANPGIYKVCMYVVVKDANGNKICDDKYCLEIEVNCQTGCECKLNPQFTYSVNPANCKYTFVGTHGGPDCLQFVEYSWDLGDGSTATGPNPTYFYGTPGTYKVCMYVVVKDANGNKICSDNYCLEIEVNCQPCQCKLAPEFSYSLNEENCEYTFQGAHGGPDCLNYEYIWNFGDGTTATGPNPTHVFASPGTYFVCLHVVAMDANGNKICDKKVCTVIDVNCQPCQCKLKPGFSYSLNEENCQYTFQGAHGGPDCLNYVEYLWNFGDGTTATGPNPTHVFASPGTYVVCLHVVAIDANGNKICDEKVCTVIDVNCQTDCECKLKPEFKYTLDEKTCVYTFEGVHGGPDCLEFVEYYWNFGDGTTAMGPNQTHVFANPGSYTVCMHVVVKDANGNKICDEKYCTNIEVNCKCECKLKPEFGYSLNEENCKYTFQGTHGGPECLQFVEYTWDFGDGTTATGPNPTHVFANPGGYYVCMYVVVKNANGEKICDDKFCMYIEVNCQCECKVKPEFKYNLDEKTCLYTFEGVHGGPECLEYVQYTWDFGDGTTATGPNPTHVYTNPGGYTVCMYVTVYNASGDKICGDKYCTDIEVNCQSDCECKLKPEFGYSLNQENCLYMFEGVHGGPECLEFVEYHWDFGDGTTATGQTTGHIFSTPGSHVVCLTVVVKNANGDKICSEKYCQQIEVRCTGNCECSLEPVFDFLLDEEDCLYSFSGFSGGPACLQYTYNVEYHWNFGDGTTATGPNPTHVFTAQGTYVVCLHVVVKNANGEKICNKKYCREIEVKCEAKCECKLKPKFKYTVDDKTCVYTFEGFHGGPDCLQFVEYFWDFGDGTTSIGQTTGHVYANTGTYKVCLHVVVKNAKGDKICEKKYCKEIVVTCKEKCDCKLDPYFEMNSLGNCEMLFTGFSGSPCTNITSMQWYVNGVGPINSQYLLQQFDVNTSYTICLVVKGTNGNVKCEKEYCQEYFFTDCYPGMKSMAVEKPAPKMELFPNPANESFKLKLLFDPKNTTQVTLKTADGKVIGKYSYGQESQEMEIRLSESIANGFIFVEVQSGEYFFIEKLMVIH